MKKLLSVFVAVAFAAGPAGLALAQTQPAPAEKKAEEKKAEEKKAPAAAKKPAAKKASGTVKSAAADSLVVAGKEKGKETEWTFAVDPKTKIRRGGKDITAADLKAGDSVQVSYTEQDGKAVAQSVVARAVKAAKAPANPCAAKPAEKPAEKK